MKKIEFILGLMFVAIAAKGQSVYIKNRCYQGFIFDTATVLFKSIEGQRSRCLLSSNDVDKVEQLLSRKLSTANFKKSNQTSGCPVIDKKLKKYYRQYVGFVNQKGEMVVWVNCFWNKDLVGQARSNVIQVNDGCSYYWSVEVNLTTSELKNLQINGTG